MNAPRGYAQGGRDKGISRAFRAGNPKRIAAGIQAAEGSGLTEGDGLEGKIAHGYVEISAVPGQIADSQASAGE